MKHVDVWKASYLRKRKGSEIGVCVLCNNLGTWRFKGKERPCLCPNGISVATNQRKLKRRESPLRRGAA
jgi:hypothetical protein